MKGWIYAAQVIFGVSSIPNPLRAATVGEFFAKLIDLAIFAGFIGAAFFIVYGGVMMMLSAGNEEKLRSAKSIITWAVVGFTILILAKVFILVVVSFVGSGRPVGV